MKAMTMTWTEMFMNGVLDHAREVLSSPMSEVKAATENVMNLNGVLGHLNDPEETGRSYLRLHQAQMELRGSLRAFAPAGDHAWTDEMLRIMTEATYSEVMKNKEKESSR